MTVSRVVNRTGYVSEKTKEKVLEIIRRTGYEVNQTALGLRTGMAKSIGVIISDISNSFFPLIIKGIDDVCSQYNYDTILLNTAEDAQKELRYIALLRQKSVKGIIISSCLSDYTEHKNTISKIIPVFFNRKPKNIGADVILNDDYKALFANTEYLIKTGHKKIAFINGPLELSTFNSRQKGFLDAMHACRIPVYKELITNGDFSIDGGLQGAKRVFNSSVFPDAVLFGNNLMTRGAYLYIRDNDIRVPEQVSIVGYGDYDWCRLVEPSLTVSVHERYEMGRRAAEVLFNRLIHGSLDAVQEVVLEPKLVLRNSVKVKSI